MGHSLVPTLRTSPKGKDSRGRVALAQTSQASNTRHLTTTRQTLGAAAPRTKLTSGRTIGGRKFRTKIKIHQGTCKTIQTEALNFSSSLGRQNKAVGEATLPLLITVRLRPKVVSLNSSQNPTSNRRCPSMIVASCTTKAEAATIPSRISTTTAVTKRTTPHSKK